jgi:DNA-binding SARP family transcriptional activator/streptogramin lyase
VEFRILGPLEVVEDGEPVALGTLKERLVLGVLLLHANEFVSPERLIDELWGVAPPPTARKAVHVYVSKLRKTLGGDGHDPIATADGGYRLLVNPDLFDADRMRSLVAGGRSRMADGHSEEASRLLHEALAVWRGPTLAGLPLESVGRDEIAELDELRITALMDRIDCDLAQGRHERVLGELQVLIREHPFRERLRGQHMLALYRSDRQADALDAYQQARRELMDELGIEPSESLQRLQQAILRHDPALEGPAGTTGANGAAHASLPVAEAVPEAVPPRPRRPAVRRRYLVAAVLVVAAAIAASVAFLASGASGRPAPSSPVSSVSPNTVAFLDPATALVIGDIGGVPKPGPMAVAAGTLWFGGRGNGWIGRYDLRAGHGMPTLQRGPALEDIAVDAKGHVWVSDRKPFVTWIGHVTDGPGVYETPLYPEQKIPVQLNRAGPDALGGGYLWVIPGTLSTESRVALIDVRHRKFHSAIRLGGRQTSAIAYGYGSAWIGTFDPEQSGGTAYLSRVRPGSTGPDSWPLESRDGAGPLAVAVGAGSVWVLTSTGNLLRIDPRNPSDVHRIPMAAEQPDQLAVGAGSVWTANLNNYSVSQIDPTNDKIVRTTPSLGRTDAVPCGIAATHAAVYVSFGDTGCG